jgi:hypothetical protein
MKKLFIKFILEPIAEFIIIQVKNNDPDIAKQWFDIGMEMDSYLTMFHDIYLFGQI